MRGLRLRGIWAVIFERERVLLRIKLPRDLQDSSITEFSYPQVFTGSTQCLPGEKEKHRLCTMRTIIMRISCRGMFAVALLLPQPSIVAAKAPAKPHLLTFGKAMEVKWFVGPSETKTMALNVRPFYVDGRLREFTLGDPHDVTDHLFVVRRAFRVNDALPQDARLPANWRWQRGGWLLVDRSSGHISPISLPYFDPFYSAASWYRDYVAYCGLADDGEKLYAVVAELGRKKPL